VNIARAGWFGRSGAPPEEKIQDRLTRHARVAKPLGILKDIRSGGRCQSGKHREQNASKHLTQLLYEYPYSDEQTDGAGSGPAKRARRGAIKIRAR
jgi:hypothetical protein